MGIAAYNRGSRQITLDIEREMYQKGMGPNPDRILPKPTPRPADWGDKARARALERARNVLRGCRKYGVDPEMDLLVGAILERERVSPAVAREVAKQVLNEPAQKNPDKRERIRAALTPELLKEPYRSRVLRGECDPRTGHCYVASEAYYHTHGGKEAGLKPMSIQHEGSPHWWIRDAEGRDIDLTAEQFTTPVPYARGVGKGFLTKKPSKRATTVMSRMNPRGVRVFQWQYRSGGTSPREVPPDPYALVPEQNRQYPKYLTLQALQRFAENRGHRVFYSVFDHKLRSSGLVWAQTRSDPTVVVAAYRLDPTTAGRDERRPWDVSLRGEKSFSELHPRRNGRAPMGRR